MQDTVGLGDIVAVMEVDLEIKARIRLELRRLRWEKMGIQKGLVFIGNNTTTNINWER